MSLILRGVALSSLVLCEVVSGDDSRFFPWKEGIRPSKIARTIRATIPRVLGRFLETSSPITIGRGMFRGYTFFSNRDGEHTVCANFSYTYIGNGTTTSRTSVLLSGFATNGTTSANFRLLRVG